MNPEPWLRGPIPGVEPLISPVLRSFEQAREDLALHMADLTAEQIWLSPHGFGSVGFHVRHIARSVERLSTYLQGRQLSTAQLAALQTEGAPGAARDELLSELEAFLNRAEQVVRTIDPATFAEAREVGDEGGRAVAGHGAVPAAISRGGQLHAAEDDVRVGIEHHHRSCLIIGDHSDRPSAIA